MTWKFYGNQILKKQYFLNPNKSLTCEISITTTKENIQRVNVWGNCSEGILSFRSQTQEVSQKSVDLKEVSFLTVFSKSWILGFLFKDGWQWLVVSWVIPLFISFPGDSYKMYLISPIIVLLKEYHLPG